MANIDLEKVVAKIKERLVLFGITYDAYQETGVLTGRTIVPYKLLQRNSSLTEEYAFYLIAKTVFEDVNSVCNFIPDSFTCNGKQVVGTPVFDRFKTAVFEEITQRSLSNNFPEFANLNILIPSDFLSMFNFIQQALA